MANPQPDIFTKLSTEILEALCRFKVPGQLQETLEHLSARRNKLSTVIQGLEGAFE